jgi:peptidoglycan/xylan/chitin deacetylase (PgdA/CDA1 family)
MHYHNLFTVLAAASLVSAHPYHQLAKRAVSPDGSCGPPNGYTCPGSTSCCSQWGWCGSSADYCGAGCQSGFGTCNGGGGSTPSPTPSPTESPTESPTQSPTQSPTSSPTPPTPGGDGSTKNIPRPKIGNVPYGSVIYNCVNNGEIAITFDDGPYVYTPHLLDLLAQYKVKATFFIVGSNGNGDIDKVTQWTDIVKRTYNEGHQIASHTWDHADLTTLSSAARKDEMYKTEVAFGNILGFFPTYMRPPYLAFDSACEADMAELGYHVISTNLDTQDWANDSPDLIVNSERTFDQFTANDPASSSFIVLNHDIHYQTVYTLAEYEIKRVQARGYRPVTVGQCLGDDPANWYRGVPRPSVGLFLAPTAEPSSEDLEKLGFAPPSKVCTYVEAPTSPQRLMGLI